MTFRDCAEVDVLLASGSDGAGSSGSSGAGPATRPWRAGWSRRFTSPSPPSGLTSSAGWWPGRYFTSEGDARDGERKMATGDLRERVDRLMEQVEDVTWT